MPVAQKPNRRYLQNISDGTINVGNLGERWEEKGKKEERWHRLEDHMQMYICQGSQMQGSENSKRTREAQRLENSHHSVQSCEGKAGHEWKMGGPQRYKMLRHQRHWATISSPNLTDRFFSEQKSLNMVQLIAILLPCSLHYSEREYY